MIVRKVNLVTSYEEDPMRIVSLLQEKEVGNG